MAKKDKQEIAYCSRSELDAELGDTISDILSAEEEAKHIIAEAEQTVKALRTEYGAKERDMREKANAELAAARDKLTADANARAAHDAASKMSSAAQAGEKLVAEKRKQINDLINKLYSELGGK